MAKAKKIFKKSRKPIIKKSFLKKTYNVINHYKGCFFGCMYCDAITPFSTVYDKRKWGRLVEIKENTIEYLKTKKNKLKNKRVLLSSLSDPYNPVEKDVRLTRKILKELINYELKELVIKTRSSLILEDINILKKFENLKISVSIFNDNSKLLNILEKHSPSCDQRIKIVDVLNKNNINVNINVYPFLPEITPLEKIIKNYTDMVGKFIIIEPNWKDNSIKSSICKMLQKISPEILVKYHTKYFNKGINKHYLTKLKTNLEKKYSTEIKILER